MDYNKDFNWERIEWKPLWVRVYGSRTVLRDRFGFDIDFDIDAHPIVIMEYEEDIIFLKSETAYWSSFDKNNLRSPYANELWKDYNGVIAKETEAFDPYLNPRYCFFSGDSLIDTTQVFVMNKTEFLECVNFNENSLYITRSVNIDDRALILNKLLDNINKNDVSITRIKLIKGQEPWLTRTESELLFCKKEMLLHDYEYITNKNQKQEAKKIIDNFKNINNLEAISCLSQTTRDHIQECEFRIGTYYDIFDCDRYFSLENRFNDLGIRFKSYTMDELNDIQDKDIASLKERASFSEFERQYYKEHPDIEQKRYPVKYYKLEDIYKAVKWAKENNEELPELDEDILEIDEDYEYEDRA